MAGWSVVPAVDAACLFHQLGLGIARRMTSEQAPQKTKPSPRRVRRKPGLARRTKAPGPELLHRITQRRGLLALAVALCFILPIELHARHGARPVAAFFAWLIYAAIIRLIILVVDRAPDGPTRRPPATTSRSRTWTVRYAVLAFLAVIALWFGVKAVKSLAGLAWPEATRAVLIIDLLFLLTLVPVRRSGRLSLADLGIRRTPRKLAVGLVLSA